MQEVLDQFQMLLDNTPNNKHVKQSKLRKARMLELAYKEQLHRQQSYVTRYNPILPFVEWMRLQE